MTVYVLQCQTSRNCKIGYTARQVQSRLRELKTAASTPLELVRWYPGLTQAHEQQLHTALGQYRVTGEWFKPEALARIDDEAEALFLTGEKDFDCEFQGKSVSVQANSVSIATLKLNGQNLKKSIIDQLPSASFDEIFCADIKASTCCFNSNVNPWGWVSFKGSDCVLIESDRELLAHRVNLKFEFSAEAKELFFSSFYWDFVNYHVTIRVVSGALKECIIYDFDKEKERQLTKMEEELYLSYFCLIKSLPQLFLAA